MLRVKTYPDPIWTDPPPHSTALSALLGFVGFQAQHQKEIETSGFHAKQTILYF